MERYIIQLKKIRHRGAIRIGIFSPYNPAISALIKNNIPGSRWSASKKMWYTDCNARNLSMVKDLLKDYVIQSEIEFLSAEQEMLLKEFAEKMEVKRYSPYTINTYSSFLKNYLLFIAKDPKSVVPEDVKNFMNDLVISKKHGYSTQNQAINAIKYFHQHILKLELTIPALERPRKEKKLPNVLSKEEVKQILNNVGNIKHKLILSLLYGGGFAYRRAYQAEKRGHRPGAEMFNYSAVKGES